MFGLGGRVLVGSALRLSLGGAYKNTVTSYLPIGYWRLGEPSGTTAADETGTTDGTYVNTPTLGASSLIHNELTSTAVTFTSTNSEHAIAVNQTAFNISTFSVSAVIQISAAPAAQQEIVAVADSVNSVTVDKTLRLQVDGRVAFYVFDGAQKTAISTDPIPLNEPVHIVGTIDATGFARIYVNGVEAGTVGATGSHTGFTTASIVIGGGVRTSPVVHFDGTIDEVAVFDRGLTPAEVLGLYNVGTPAPAPDVTYSGVVLNTSPMVYWRLGESAGTTAVDEVGAQDGTYNNTPALGTTGLLDGVADTAVGFTFASNHYVEAINQSLFNTSLYSISMIIQIPAYPGSKLTISAVTGGGYNGGSKDKELWLNTDGTLQFHSYPGASKFTNSSGPMPLNVPIHVAVSINGTTAKLYINGVEDGTVDTTGSYASFTNAAQLIGGQADSNTFDGIIDEVAVWNRGITPAEVLSIYNAAAAPYNERVLNRSPVRYWRLGEPSGTTATDETGNQDGTYVGAPTLGVTGAIVGDTDTAITTALSKYVDVGVRPTAIAHNTAFSVETWINTTDLSNAIISDFNGTGGFHIGFDVSGNLEFYLEASHSSNGIWMNWSSTFNINDGNWHHLVATHDGTGTAAGITLYLDGTAITVSSILADTLVSAVPSTTNLLIGRHGVGTAGYEFIGSIDEVAIYPDELTATEVADLYATGT